MAEAELDSIVMVRGGEQAVLADRLEQEGYLTIGWLKGLDLAEITTREAIDALMKQEYGDAYPNGPRQVRLFRLDLGPGRRVMTYNLQRGEYLLGEVTGPYEYRPDLGYTTRTGEYEHVFPVEWQARVPKSELNVARKRLEYPQTVFEIHEPEQLREIEAIAERHPIETSSKRNGEWRGWVTFARPDRWNLAEQVKTRAIGDIEPWGVRKGRMRSEMRLGDPVVMYQGGSAAPGVYAIAEVASLPYEMPLRASDPSAENQKEWVFDLRFVRFLEEPITKQQMLEDPALRGLNAISARGGAVFWMRPEEWDRFRQLLDSPGTSPRRLAAPLASLFKDWDEAWWAFDFLKETLTSLGVSEPGDARFSVTMPTRERAIHLNFGQWFIAGFYGAGRRNYRARLVTAKDAPGFEPVAEFGDFSSAEGQPVFCIFGLSDLAHMKDMPEEMRGSWEAALETARSRFSTWSGTPYRNAHTGAVAEAIFDESVRESLFANGLSAEPVDEWDPFVEWALRVWESPGFVQREEIDYKVDIALSLSNARRRLLVGDAGWREVFMEALRNKVKRLVSFQTIGHIGDWFKADGPGAEQALRDLWTGEPDEAMFRRFHDSVPDAYKQARSNPLLACLLSAVDINRFPPYPAGTFGQAYQLVGYEYKANDMRADYARALKFLDVMIEKCNEHGVLLSDRLEAQSVLFAMMRIDQDWHPDDFTADDVRRLQAYREGRSVDVYGAIKEQGYDFPDWLVTDYLLSLATKPFVILSGISGTGKTKMAQLVSEHLTPAVQVEVQEAAVTSDEPGVPFKVGRVLKEHFYIPLPVAIAPLLDAPERGTGLDVIIGLWDGRKLPGRVQNIAMTSTDRLDLRLYFKAESRDWVRRELALGEYMRLRPSEREGVYLEIEKVGSRTETRPETTKRVELIAVRPDWTDNRALLGFHNPLTGRYHSTPLLELMLRAERDPDRPYFAILDEMNLARVEHYFSDFLSSVESGEPMHLHNSAEELLVTTALGEEFVIPGQLRIPRNVFFTGTVNVDETTYMFSPKVLDRANVIEFNEVDLGRYSGGSASAAGAFRLGDGTAAESVLGDVMAQAEIGKPWACRDDWTQCGAKVRQVIMPLHDILAKHHMHFGYRVVNEIGRFVRLSEQYVGAASVNDALDLQILQKVLPKLSGNRAKLEEPLGELKTFLAAQGMTRSADKVARMLDSAAKVGYASFVE